MARYNQRVVRPRATSPVTTTGETTTHEGGRAWSRDPLSELVLLAVVNMVGQSTFYESAEGRDNRFAGLCRAAALADPTNFLGFLRWLRGEANMRTASLVAAAEGIKARLDAGLTEPFEVDDRTERRLAGPRTFVDAVLQRPDEPGEFIGYWISKYGKNLPKPVKRGLSDAAGRLYNERSLLKYDTTSHAVRFGDVLELAHVQATAPWQGDLFTYALHRRHGYYGQIPEGLTVIDNERRFRSEVDRHPEWLYDPERLRAAGLTWEDALSISGNVSADKRKVWEAMIPNMGIMALIRNLRNFDEAKVSDKAAQLVVSKLMDPEQIAKSRQFPYRFLSAYRAAPSLRWGYALERALNASLSNLPTFDGRSLVMVDTSASMRGTVSDKSKVRHVDVGALTGVALAHRSTGSADLIGFADGAFGFNVTPGGSVLKDIEEFCGQVGRVGHGTNTVNVLRQVYNGHKRVVIVHDGQFGAFQAHWHTIGNVVPKDVPVYSIDTSGYAGSPLDTSVANRYEVGGFSDKLFTMISMLDAGQSVKWPWVK
jgi:hypothetical protein